MSGLSNMFNAINDPARYGADWIQMFSAEFIPQIMTLPTSAIDPYYRRADSVIDAWRKKFPGLSRDVPPVRNVWGEAAIKEGGVFWRTISPVKKAEAREDAVDQELKTISYEMGFPNKTIIGNFKLDARHYDIYQRATGRKIKQLLDNIVANPEYQALPDEARALVNAEVE